MLKVLRAWYGIGSPIRILPIARAEWIVSFLVVLRVGLIHVLDDGRKVAMWDVPADDRCL